MGLTDLPTEALPDALLGNDPAYELSSSSTAYVFSLFWKDGCFLVSDELLRGELVSG